MHNIEVVGKINGYLHTAAKLLESWLDKMLPKVSENWWQECVLDKLSYNQRMIAENKNITKLAEFDLAALLRIADRNWYAMRDFAYLPTKERECIREMVVVRNKWAHCSGELPDKESIKRDIATIIEFLEQRSDDDGLIQMVRIFSAEIDTLDAFDPPSKVVETKNEPVVVTSEIKEKSLVFMVAQPDVRGVVLSVENIGAAQKYDVFIDGGIKTFYTGQIKLVNDAPDYNWIDLPTLQSYLSAFEINNPSAGNLYSLNSARIDFVPYQFRPALKMIKSDEPRILIADSVGVGKTIEAGLIIEWCLSCENT